MKRTKQLVALLLAVAMFAAACGSDDDSDTEAGADDETSESTEASDAEAEADGEEEAPAEDGAEGEEAGPEGPYEHLAQAQAGEFEGAEVEVLAQWVEGEAENFEAVLTPFEEATGIDVTYEGLTDYETVLNVRVEGGNAPDMAQIAQPGTMQAFAESGALVPLSDWINTDQLSEDYISSFTDLASHNGDLYGVYFKGDLKSIVWYPVDAFAEAGYEVPTTWDELVALSDQIIADGNGSPWCVSMEHGDATGWVATDWIEDILLRTAPPEVYDQWVAHEIPFDDPEVLEAAEMMSEIWFTPDYVFGGSTNINATFVGDTQTPMFDEAGPQCWMHKQAAWIPEFWPEGTEAGVDSSFFYFPSIEEEYGSPVLGAGDMFVMFDDRPEVRALMEYLATAEAARPWIEAGGFVSPNQSVPLDWYGTYPNDELAAILNDASTFRFDASDTMPAEVGSGSFWSGMIDWVAADGAGTEDVFAEIEASWPAAE